MQDVPDKDIPWHKPPPDAQAGVLALADEVRKLVALARAMTKAGRRVRLAGLDSAVGLLCAKTLDLPPRLAPPVRAQLLLLAAELDRLHAAMNSNQRRPPCVPAD